MIDDVRAEGRRVADVLPLIGAVALEDGTPLPLYDCDSYLATDEGWKLRATGDLTAYRAARARWEALRDDFDGLG